MTGAVILPQGVPVFISANKGVAIDINNKLTTSAIFTDSKHFVVYDSFDTEISTTLWTLGGTNHPTWSNTNTAGTAAGEAQIAVDYANETSNMVSKALPSNRHYFIKTNIGNGGGGADTANCYVEFGNGTDGWTTALSISIKASMPTGKMSVFIRYLGNNNYEAYVGVHLAVSSTNKPNGLQLRFRTQMGNEDTTNTIGFRVDDVSYSNSS